MNPLRGGVQKVSNLLANFFIAKGHQVFYLVHEKAETDTFNYPVTIYYLPDINFFSAANLYFYRHLLYELGIDFIINHDASNQRSLLFLNTGNHFAKKISLHHNDPIMRMNSRSESTGKAKFLPRFLLNKYKIYKTRQEINYLIDHSDKVVLLSNAFIVAIGTKMAIRSSKLTAISNPVQLTEKEIKGAKKNQILYVGRIEMKQKRLDHLLYIWSKVSEIFPDWELIILGDGPDKMKVEQMALDEKLKNISFKGYVDPEPFYRKAAVICMTSEYEGFGMVLVEAMQNEVVPIAFDNWASLRDIIVDRETGLLVPYGDRENYIQQLIELIKHRQLREKIAANAHQHIQKFDINVIGKQWLSLFAEMNLVCASD